MSTSRKTLIGGLVGVIVAIGLIIAGAYAFGGLGSITGTSSIRSTTTSVQSISTTSGGGSTGGGPSSTTSASSTGGGSSGSTGVLQISMIDPPHVPVNVVDVYVNYSGIQVLVANASNSSGWYKVASGGTLNLTSIISSSQVLGSATLPAGTYTIVRFNITSAIVTVNGTGGTLTNYSASVPGGMVQSTITGGVTVQANAPSGLLIDISPTVTGANGSYTLIPSATAHPQAPVNMVGSVTTTVTQSDHTTSVITQSHTTTSHS